MVGKCKCCTHPVLYEEDEIEYCPLHEAAPIMYEKLNKVRKWLMHLAEHTERKVIPERFLVLRDAYIADAKMYRATIADIDIAIAKAEGKTNG